MGRGYHKRYILERIAAMQAEYLSHQNSGRTEMYIYRTYIKNVFFISRSTFYRWLTINPTKVLAAMDRQEATAGPTAEPTQEVITMDPGAEAIGPVDQSVAKPRKPIDKRQLTLFD